MVVGDPTNVHKANFVNQISEHVAVFLYLELEINV